MGYGQEVKLQFLIYEVTSYNCNPLTRGLVCLLIWIFLVSVSDKLYTEFLESLLVHGREQQVFDIVKDFIQNCDNTLEVLRESNKSGGPKASAL